MPDARDRLRNGASPEAMMAIVDSDIHHLREQSDMDRRRFATRLNEDRKRLDELQAVMNANTVILARLSDNVERLGEALKGVTATTGVMLSDVHKGKGALSTMRWLFGGGVAFELLRVAGILK